MKIGYARVSRKDQNLALQLLALKREGCDRIFREKKSGAVWNRPELAAALATLKDGDTLVVWHLDRLGRTARELLNLNFEFKGRNISLKSLTEAIDTETPDGEYHFILTCANAQRERARISQRTKEGLQAARLRGVKLGRPRRLKPAQITKARLLSKTKKYSVDDLAHRFDVGKTTMHRALVAHA